MTELDLLLIRQREHEICALELRIKSAEIRKSVQESRKHRSALKELLDAQINFACRIEQQGHDYLIITAEMARIRAEVRGEK